VINCILTITNDFCSYVLHVLAVGFIALVGLDVSSVQADSQAKLVGLV